MGLVHHKDILLTETGLLIVLRINLVTGIKGVRKQAYIYSNVLAM